MIRPFALVILSVALGLPACGEIGSSSPLKGEWTPIGIDDCGPAGSVVAVSDDAINYRAGKNDIRIMKVSGARIAGGQVDLTVQARKYDHQNPDQWAEPSVLRFDMSGDEARVQGMVTPAGDVLPIPPEIKAILTMQRCR